MQRNAAPNEDVEGDQRSGQRPLRDSRPEPPSPGSRPILHGPELPLRMTNETTNVPADSTEEPQSPMPTSDSGVPPTADDANAEPLDMGVTTEVHDGEEGVAAEMNELEEFEEVELTEEQLAAEAEALAAADAAEAAAAAEAEALEMASRNWFGTLPSDWESWCFFRDQVNETLRVRESFLNWLSNNFDETADAYKLGLGRSAAGQLSRAIPLLAGENTPFAKLLTGTAQMNLGQHEEAVATLSSINDASEIGARARIALVDHAFSTRNAEALQSAALAVKKAGDAPAHQAFAEGALLEADGEHQAAIDAWARAVEADPKHAEATFRLAELLDLYGDDENAQELYDRFRNGELPPQVGALMNLGTMHEDNQNHPWATSCFQMVVNADPENERARHYLSNARASSIQYYDEGRERSADKQNAVMRIPVTDFELSVRARNCLQRMAIHTLGDLVSRTESELLSFKNFGETSLQEVKDILVMKGLRLGMMPTMEVGPAASAATAGPVAGTGDVMEILISELDLSVRSRAALAMLGIVRVRDLTSANETTLMSCKNFGQTSLDEIRSKLRNLGLELAK